MTNSSVCAGLAISAACAALHPSFAAERTVALAVPGMNCAACPITVRKALEKVPGVTKVTATYKPKEAVVTFDDARTSVENLLETTRKAGYPASVKP